MAEIRTAGECICTDPDDIVNSNNSEAISYSSDESDFEIEITPGFFPDTVSIEIVPKQKVTNTVQDLFATVKCDQVEIGPKEKQENENVNVEIIASTQTVSEQSLKIANKTISNRRQNFQKHTQETPEKTAYQEETNKCILENEDRESTEVDDLDDIEIQISEGECPGTVSINIVSAGLDLADQPSMFILDSPKSYYETETDTKAILLEESESSITNSRFMTENDLKTETELPPKEIKTIVRNKTVSGSSRISQSSPCLPDSGKTNLTSCKTGQVSKLSAETGETGNVYEKHRNLHDASDLIVLENQDETEGFISPEADHLDQGKIARPTNKRNQELPDKETKLKRFKGTSNLLLARRQGAMGNGDYIQKAKEKDRKSSILDEVDPVIPRVIPKSGKQVKFGDEIQGSRLIQPSPEKRFSADEISPNKADRSILKKSSSSNAKSIEPQVYYNSSYFDDDSDSKDSGLSEGDDYRRWEYRNDEHHLAEDYSSFHSARDFHYNAHTDESHYQLENMACASNRQTYDYQTTRWYEFEQPRYIARRTDREEFFLPEKSVDPYQGYGTEPKHNGVAPSENYPRILQNEMPPREKHSPIPSFISNGSSKRATHSKKKQSSKQARRDKKHGKKRGKNGVETDLERFRRLLGTGQVRLASRGNIDVRKIKLEYLLHIGDFSLKYKTTPGLTESMTLTIYTDVVGPSIDVRHMLQMQSSFINRLRFCLRRGNEVWLMHKFLHLGALQVLMNRDPYRDVLGEVHAQFITAGLLIGINYLHQNGITHGNLYPWKVLINDRGYPVLTGFLPLYDCDDPITSELRERRSYIFSVPYAAPDRFIGDMHPSVDIFSIGCIAYEIITGRTPFYGGSEERTKENILSYSYRPVYDYDTFSFAGEMFIDSCLRKHIAHRFVPGRHLSNLYHEEWLSTLDLGQYEDQTLDSPILDVIQLLHEGKTLELEERNLDYDWGRVMDIMSPYAPTLVC